MFEIEDVLNLSKKAIVDWYNKNDKTFKDNIGETFSWIASGENNFYRDKESAMEALNAISDAVHPCKITDMYFEIVNQSTDTILVMGRYIATLDEKECIMSEPQRVSFLWVKENEVYKIHHLHLSNPMASLAPDEEFPVQASKHNYDYLLNKLVSNEIFELRQVNGKNVIVEKKQIEYVEAKNVYVYIHTINNEIYYCHYPISNLYNDKLNDFINPHRSYLINPLYIESYNSQNITLLSKVVIPISRLKKKEIGEFIKTINSKGENKK